MSIKSLSDVYKAGMIELSKRVGEEAIIINKYHIVNTGKAPSLMM